MPRAFTLIEVLITVALFVVLVLGVAQLYVVYGRIISLQNSSISVTLGGSAIMDAARSAGLQASHIAASHSFSGVNRSSGASTAVFELPAVDASGAIIPATYDYIGIYAEGADAYRVIDAAPGSVRVSGAKRLTDMLGALTFTYDNADFSLVSNVMIDATTTASVREQTTSVHLQEHLYFRNL